MLRFMQNLFGAFASAVVQLLPDSPFAQYLDMWANLPYLSYINWLIPVGSCVKVLATWVSAILLFYVVMAILRWVKILGE